FNVIATRADAGVAAAVAAAGLAHAYHAAARLIIVRPTPSDGIGLIAVVSAGTADIPVAEEAALVAEALGNRVERLYDCGVAGLHRLLAHYDTLAEANVIVAVAGMEGALPSVIGGLVDRPVIAVPTSIGYGASFGGIAALLAMLNSCAPGVSLDALRTELAKLPLTGWELVVREVRKGAFRATKVDVEIDHHAHHHHRTLGDIVAILDASTLRDSIKDKARRIFTRLADAEA